jgi:glycosyltransferase involved in cell wall biosynthesis
VEVPAISVVVPTPGGRFVGEAVASVVGQTVVDWELVVVDDGSRDGTAELVAAFAAADSRIKVLTLPRNEGVAAARNLGLASISLTSKYVAFLDNDDVWLPWALEVLREALAALPDAAAAHGTAIEIDECGRERPGGDVGWPVYRMGLSRKRLVRWPPDRPTEFSNLAVEDCIVSVGSGLIRRAALQAVGGFDPRAEHGEDYDMWIRLSRRGPIAFIDRVVLKYRQHEGQASKRPPPRGRGIGYVRYKTIASLENTPEQRRLAVAGYRVRQRQLLGQRWSDLRTAWANGDLAAIARNLTLAAMYVPPYVRGRPWWWHR